jgi:MSHA pilin protein MshC
VKYRGFTLVELIITIIIIGVLATTIAPKFLGSDDEDAISLRDRALQFMRNMQLRAMHNVQDTSCVKITADLVAPPAGHLCTNSISSNFDDDQVISSTEAGLTFQALDANGAPFSFIQFDGLGRPANLVCTTPCTLSVGQASACISHDGAIYAC